MSTSLEGIRPTTIGGRERASPQGNLQGRFVEMMSKENFATYARELKKALIDFQTAMSQLLST